MTKPDKDEEYILDVRVIPRASRTEIVGLVETALKVRIAAPPVDGAANAELIKVLAKALSVARSNVEIVGGGSSRSKRVRITGVTAEDIQRILRAKT